MKQHLPLILLIVLAGLTAWFYVSLNQKLAAQEARLAQDDQAFTYLNACVQVGFCPTGQQLQDRFNQLKQAK
jgi:hypothetical protein